MAIASHTISINPAFLQEIKDDHHELRQLMHHTAAMLNRPSGMRLERDRLFELLAKLRDQLAMHFSLEEAYGYYEDAVTAAPHMSRRAEKLRAQHSTLFSQLGRLVERTERLRYHETPLEQMPHLTAEYNDFAEQLREHESLESQLVIDAFNEEFGAGD